MSKKARWLLALLVGATLASPAGAQIVRRENRGPVVVDRTDTIPSGPLLVVDTPRDGQTVSGVVAVTGFALDKGSINRVELSVDGVSVGYQAVLDIPRHDVSTAFPDYLPYNPAPGWGTSFVARNYTDGTHALTLAVTAGDSTVPTTFGPINVVVNNEVNQPPFGRLEIPGADPTVSANGSQPVLGWALDDSDIDHIDFLVDGAIVATAVGRGGVGNATYGTTRPDVFAVYPYFAGPNPHSLYSGFVANLDTTRWVDGMHTVSVRAYDDQGASQEIGSSDFQVMNNGGLLPPFGSIEYPMDESTLICGPASVVVPPPTGGCPSPCFPGGGGSVPVSAFPNLVRGWALDTGIRPDLGQVEYLELMLDGNILSNTRTDCTVAGSVPGNCYFLSRPDVAQMYQGFPNSANAGFQFLFAVTRDPFLGLFDIFVPTPFGTVLTGYSLPGIHQLSLRVGDVEETVTEWGQMTVNLTCDLSSATPDKASFGYVDSPMQEQFINGAFQVLGWAADLDGAVSSVELAVDGTVVATLTTVGGTYGLRRDDVVAKDNRVASPFVGFAYVLDTTHLGDSEHDLTVYANSTGHRTLIGRRKFVVFNNSGTKQ